MLWRKYPEDKRYYISEYGDVLSFARSASIILKASIINSGYKTITLGQKRTTVHEVVALTFIGKRPDGLHINHIDGNKLNNHHENLEYCTISDNMMHSFKKGLNHVGEKHGQAKLKNKDVLSIVREYKNGHTVGSIAKRYNVCKKTVYNIINGKTWNHLQVRP